MAKFRLGQIVWTQGVDALICEGMKVLEYIGRHASGDWGDVGEEDAAENELSLKEGFRLLSAYDAPQGKIWIITEADRSATTVLLPDEY